MNKDVMLRLADFIQKNADHFDMAQWWTHPDEESGMDYNEVKRLRPLKAKELFAHCGTSACVAGSAIVMEYPDATLVASSGVSINEDLFESDVQYLAANILGLTHSQSLGVFFRDNWPRKYKQIAKGIMDVATNAIPGDAPPSYKASIFRKTHSISEATAAATFLRDIANGVAVWVFSGALEVPSRWEVPEN